MDDSSLGRAGGRRPEERDALRAQVSPAALLDAFPLPIWRSGLDAECDHFNRAWLDFTGRTLEQELSTAWAEGVHPEDLDRCMSTYLGAFEAREPFELRYRLRRHDGEYRWVIDFGRPFEDVSGDFAGYIGALIDDTERREKEQQLFLAQKMQAVGRLAGGIAHDFSNILMAVTGYASMLLDDIPEWDGRHSYVAQIQRAADRATALTRQLLVFSSEQVPRPRPLDLNQVIRGISRILTRVLGEDIDVEMRLAENLPAVAASTGQMEQVIVNLAVNSLDAMPDGGKLAIATESLVLDEQSAGVRDLAPGPHVELSIIDDGCGMSAEVQDQAFDPFFSTQASGGGPGLGLSTIYGIVQQSGGRITLESSVGAGTTVRVIFPVEEGAAPEVEPPAFEAMVQGDETVLVVDDDEAVNRLVARILEGQGYRALAAADGIAAVELSERHEGPIHLVITDVVMPRMSGGELAEKITGQRPDTRFLFISGYSDRAREQLPKDLGPAFLAKPFRPLELTQRVRDILDMPPTGA